MNAFKYSYLSLLGDMVKICIHQDTVTYISLIYARLGKYVKETLKGLRDIATIGISND